MHLKLKYIHPCEETGSMQLGRSDCISRDFSGLCNILQLNVDEEVPELMVNFICVLARELLDACLSFVNISEIATKVINYIQLKQLGRFSSVTAVML